MSNNESLIQMVDLDKTFFLSVSAFMCGCDCHRQSDTTSIWWRLMMSLTRERLRRRTGASSRYSPKNWGLSSPERRVRKCFRDIYYSCHDTCSCSWYDTGPGVKLSGTGTELKVAWLWSELVQYVFDISQWPKHQARWCIWHMGGCRLSNM